MMGEWLQEQISYALEVRNERMAEEQKSKSITMDNEIFKDLMASSFTSSMFYQLGYQSIQKKAEKDCSYYQKVFKRER